MTPPNLNTQSKPSRLLLADVALPNPLQQLWTYKIPDALKSAALPGIRVLVPFRNSVAAGMICRVYEEAKNEENSAKVAPKPIQALIDSQPVLDKHLLAVILWVSKYYGASPGMSLQAALPAGLNFSMRACYRIAAGANPYGISAAAQDIFDTISTQREAPKDDIERRFQGQLRTMQRMLKDGLLEEVLRPSQRVKATKEWWLVPNRNLRLEQRAKLDDAEGRKWARFINEFLEEGQDQLLRSVETHPLCTPYTLKKALDGGFIRREKRPLGSGIQPDATLDHRHRLNPLNAQQQQAFEAIRTRLKQADQDAAFEAFLLRGVTGSGKTEVYMHAMAEALRHGQSALVLVPEIALTPQTLTRFKNVFGDVIGSLHSRQSPQERLTTWDAIARGRYRIVLGPRSAVFAPIPALGLIVVDEEHDGSYRQQDPEPRYHARDVAVMRAQQLKIPIVMGSATPNLVSMQRAVEGKFQLLELRARHGQARLPEVELIDLKQYRSAMSGPLSSALRIAIEERLDRKEQCILLLNRRGYGAYIQSASTGEVAECPHCSVSLTYHKHDQSVRCHYCGYSTAFRRLLQKFGEENTLVQGFGTQQVEEQLRKLFPQASILRMDQDSTTGKGGHEKVLTAFGKGEADILLGTQMVAKGLDFPNVTLVGILQGDSELGFPIFQAAEHCFQLLSQVSGRSGRAEKPGHVLIQSWQPSHPVFSFVQKHDYEGFFAWERSNRRSLLYPPFSKIVAWHLKGLDATATADAAHKLQQVVADRWIASGGTPDQVLGPSPSVVMRQQRRFSWDLMLKIPWNWNTEKIHALGVAIHRQFLEQYSDAKGNDLRLSIDVDIK